MADEVDVDAKIAELAAKAKSMSVDGTSKTEISIDEMIRLDKHQSRKNATASSRMGLRIGMLQPPEH